MGQLSKNLSVLHESLNLRAIDFNKALVGEEILLVLTKYASLNIVI